MLSFKKKKKRLNLKEMHSLYLTLKDCLPEQEEKLLIDQLKKMLEKMTPEMFIGAYRIMYGKAPQKTSLHTSVEFIQGLKECNFFEYISFLDKLRGSSDKQ